VLPHPARPVPKPSDEVASPDEEEHEEEGGEDEITFDDLSPRDELVGAIDLDEELDEEGEAEGEETEETKAEEKPIGEERAEEEEEQPPDEGEDRPRTIPMPIRPPIARPDAPPRAEMSARQPGADAPKSVLEVDEDDEEELEPLPVAVSDGYELPKVEEMLELSVEKTVSAEELRERAKTIEQTLQSLSAPGRVVEINRGPVITQFGVEPDYVEVRGGRRTKVKVGKISALAEDLALALSAKTIRIEAPVPGKGFVGVEVPNPEPSIVGLRDVYDTPEFRDLRSPLKLALGQDVAGKPIVADLTAMPHLLIAGTTGSGKSVCVNGIICTLLLQHTPTTLKMIMIDPKRVELTNYNGIPHLMAPVVVDLERIVGVLKWVQREMDERYRRFAKAGARNILDYNQRVAAGRLEGGEHMHHIIVVVDELADLMMLAPDETERVITRLAQMARATGIHIIISTQRPSVDVVTGLIKANFPARIAFAVATGVDSRVILDMPGAEKLLGRGDMLFQAPDAPMPVRAQGVFVSDQEIQRIVNYWRDAAKERQPTPGDGRPEAESVISEPGDQKPPRAEAVEGGSDVDDLYDQAVALARENTGRVSVPLLQRRLRIGHARAMRLIDIMRERGVLSEGDDD
jgi:S-DNA-T family DNA segregation ATPase FtsK/SpoIIIE